MLSTENEKATKMNARAVVSVHARAHAHQCVDCTFCTGTLLCFHKYYLIHTKEHNSIQHLRSILRHSCSSILNFVVFLLFCFILFHSRHNSNRNNMNMLQKKVLKWNRWQNAPKTGNVDDERYIYWHTAIAIHIHTFDSLISHKSPII